MSEYTPSEFEPLTDTEMREIFLDRDLEEWAKLNPKNRNASGVEWDRWLAAHDAEVRAGVVTEEPEWEYRCRLRSSLPGIEHDWVPVDDDHIEMCEGGVQERRRKAGPWAPVEQEGADTDE